MRVGMFLGIYQRFGDKIVASLHSVVDSGK